MNKIVKKILVAEDTLGWQKFHESLLKEYDKVTLEYDIMDSAQEALLQAQNHLDTPYDLILTDLQMESTFLPKFAGEWLVEQIKSFSAYETTPIVIVSAAYNIAFIASVLNVDYLSKRVLINNPDTYFLKLDEYFM